MRTLHHALMGMTLLAVLTVAAGLLQPWSPAAIAQHGGERQAEAQAHFDAMVEKLELTDEQRAAIAPEFGRAYGLMLELHQIHERVAAELTDEQKEAFAGMVHEMLGGAMSQAHHGDEHAGDRHHGGGRH